MSTISSKDVLSLELLCGLLLGSNDEINLGKRSFEFDPIPCLKISEIVSGVFYLIDRKERVPMSTVLFGHLFVSIVVNLNEELLHSVEIFR